MLAVPLLLFALLYAVLLITPIPLPFVNQQVRNVVMASMPAGSELELGDMALALEGFIWPVIQFKPVVYTDGATGGQVKMEALEVGFSPLRALIGQPGATVTIVGPHLQVNQDIFGPRLARFELVPDPNGGPDTVRVLEGQASFPEVSFSPEGVDVRGELPPSGMQMRSDNDWLIYNLEAASQGLRSIVDQAAAGNFSRLVVRRGTLDMNDALYGLFRTFEDMTLDIAPTRDGKGAEGRFSANFGGTVMTGNIEQVPNGQGQLRLRASVTNLDLSSVMPMMNDPEAQVSVVGASAVSMDVGFEAESGKIVDGLFHIDMTGTDLRVEDDYFPIVTSIMEVRWDPAQGTFTMGESQFNVAGSSGYGSGVFRLGMDDLYGPIVGISFSGRDVSILSEAGAPESPFQQLSFQGWSAPLYGAVGIDQFAASKADGSRLASRGRIDTLRRGMGFDMTVAGEGISADDLKRLWPYFISPESRNWFVKNVTGGRIKTSTMRFSFPAGTLPEPGENKPMPKNALAIDITGVDVQIRPMENMAPIRLEGETRFSMQDANLSVAATGASLATDAGTIAVANVGLVMGSEVPGEQLIEISGDLSGAIPAIISFIEKQQPEALKGASLPLDLKALGGRLTLGLVSTIGLDAQGKTTKLDYAVNGVVQDFGSSAPIQGRTFSNGQLSFVASQAGYRVTGQADIDGLTADVVISGKSEKDSPPPEILLSATIDAADFKKMGVDVSQYLKGKVKFVARPMADSSIQLAVDLDDAALTVSDLGLSKAAGVKGSAQAAIRQKGGVTEVSQIEVAFGDVRLEGGLGIDAKNGLQSAEFTSIALSPGDSAQLSVSPIRGGYQVRIRGDQLDLKPLLKRFDLGGVGKKGGGSGGLPGGTQTIALDVELKRALGYFRTTAFNLNLDLALRGADLQRLSLQTNFGGNSNLSVATNPTPGGKTMSVAFNDLGTVLRLVGVYPNLEGGSGSLVMNMNDSDKVSSGTFDMREFAIVNENNVAQILGNHRESKQMIARSNKLGFRSGEVDFVMRKDRVEITDAVLAGDTVGGTARGFIYTDQGQYDITGTYVPLFGLNNAFSKLLGPLAGRDGEGLFGVTFAVRGPLDKPDFRVNPMSALVPGAFRRMFEYRAREIPRTE